MNTVLLKLTRKLDSQYLRGDGYCYDGSIEIRRCRMAKAPRRCPMCKERRSWKKIDTQRKGFSVGKAVVGRVIAGPIGLVGGALGKKKVFYACGNCGFKHEYNA